MLAIVAASAAGAQSPRPRVQPEFRTDVIAGYQPAVQVGLGAQLPLGTYVRLGAIGAAGIGIGAGARAEGTVTRGARVDLLGRFLLDPFRQSRLGLSLGGGLSVRAEQGDRARPWLLLAAEVEGRRMRRGIVPALQVGIGGGARVGLVLRGAAERTR